MNAIWTQRGHYEENLTQEGWGKCAPTHTRKNRGRPPPPSVRATRRHGDTATDGNKPEIEPTSDIFTRADRRADSDKKTRQTANHAATVPPMADERQERRRKDTARPPHQPTRAAADIRTPKDGKRTTPERRESDTPTPRERAHTSRTAADMYARKGATRVVMPIVFYIIYIYIYAATALCIFILCAYLSYLYIYS